MTMWIRPAALAALTLASAAPAQAPSIALPTVTGPIAENAQAGAAYRGSSVQPTTGPLAFFTEHVPFVLDQVQKTLGGNIDVNGTQHPFEIIVKDSQSNPNRAAEVAQELILQDEVDLIATFATPETVKKLVKAGASAVQIAPTRLGSQALHSRPSIHASSSITGIATSTPSRVVTRHSPASSNPMAVASSRCMLLSRPSCSA